MPELPEVETTARELRAELLGRRILSVGAMDWPRMLPNTTSQLLAEVVTGRTISVIDRRGKYLRIGLGAGVWLAFHRKMSGNLLLVPSLDSIRLHTHFLATLDDGQDLRFVDPRKFGRMYLFQSDDEERSYFDGRLGPEPLSDLTPVSLKDLLRGRRGRIKSLLLDQKFIAGVGNLYADEALWEARIHPLRTAGSLSKGEIGRLAGAIKLVLEAGIAHRGTTFSGYLDARGLPGENQLHLKAYGRGALRGQPAQPCERCGTPLQRIVLGLRSSHFCPRCQRAPPHEKKPTRPVAPRIARSSGLDPPARV